MGNCASSRDLTENIRQYLHKVIDNLSVQGFIYIALQLISFVLMVISLSSDTWLNGRFGNQGLWRYCTWHNNLLCCADIKDDAIDRQGFVDATNAFLILQCLIFLVAFILSYREQVEKYDCTTRYSAIVWIPIAICSLLSMTIYGAKHSEISERQTLSDGFTICVINFFLQVIIVIVGMNLTAVDDIYLETVN